MKNCRVCGVEIINGKNGCMLMGDICNHCNPEKFTYKIARNFPIVSDCGDYEGKILARQETLYDD